MKSQFLKNKVLDYLLGKTAYITPDTLYLATFTQNPSESYPSGVEPLTSAWTNYSRVPIANNPASWNMADNGVKSNKINFTFGSAIVPETQEKPLIIGVGLFDQRTGGNLLYYGILRAPFVVAHNMPVDFPATKFVISEV